MNELYRKQHDGWWNNSQIMANRNQIIYKIHGCYNFQFFPSFGKFIMPRPLSRIIS